MKSSRRDFFRRLTCGAAGAVIGGAAVTGCRKKKEQGDDNPYAYDLTKLKKVDPALLLYKELTPINVQVEAPTALVLDRNNHLHIGGVKAVIEYTETGDLVTQFAVDSPVRALAVDRSGKLYLGMTDHVEVWSSRGEQLQVWEALDRQAVITSIVLSDDSVFVADAGNKRVYRFDPDGAFQRQIEAPKPGFIVPSPWFDLAADPGGSVWVVNPGRHVISKINPDGTLSETWGKTSYRIEGFSGCCNPTHLLVLPNGDFVTSEKGLPRVKLYDPVGKFKGVVAGPEQFDENVTGLDPATDSRGVIYVLDPMRKQIRRFQLKEGMA